ncbi:Spy/CpxP family protein refolding chaperone [Gloeobacter violaceus]|nr:periplasmic heavy metal sensor [Gloeobacter violaceus]
MCASRVLPPLSILLLGLLLGAAGTLAEPVAESLDLRGLGLSSEQRSRIQDLRREDQQQAAPLRDNLNSEQQQLRTLYTSDAPDDQLRSQYDRMQVYRQRLDRQRFENLLRIRSVLTPGQRTQLRARFVERGGRGGGRGGGPLGQP